MLVLINTAIVQKHASGGQPWASYGAVRALRVQVQSTTTTLPS